MLAKKEINGAELILKIGNLVTEPVDAIVNAANTRLAPGGGVCGAIYQAAGPAPFDECQAILKNEGIASIRTGEARATGPGKLAGHGVKKIIHAAGPQGSGEEELRAAYTNSLKLAVKNQCRTIAFPSISTGIYGYPIDEAAKTALAAITDFLNQNPSSLDKVFFIFLDSKTADHYTTNFKS